MLQIINLSKVYGEKRVINNISLKVDKGDIFGFIGHNGAGKTTTIKSIVGILKINHGDILIDGYSIKKNPDLCKKKIAYIPDNPDIYDNLTGIQYLNFISDIYDINKNDRKNQIIKYSNIFKLTNDLNNKIASYSHGMKQKLLFISAIIHKPQLLVLDEPFVGLDPIATYNVKKIMEDLCQNGSAIFFSTHVLEVAEKLCNKIAIIKNGEIKVNGLTKNIIRDNSLEYLFMELVDNE